MKSKKWLLILGVWLWLAAACRVETAGPQLTPQYQEFLSQVGYIITPEEKKAFLAMPDADKPAFIEEFWKRRDPDPSTPENEYKNEYLKRVAKANQLFVGEGRPGHLTDRGRIYILFGPPAQRSTTPLGGDASGRCQEIWYYGDFPVVFVDRACGGTFMLETLDLGQLHDLNMAQANAQNPIVQEDKPLFDFDLSIRKKSLDEARFEGAVVIQIPYTNIWFSAEGEKFKTTFELQLELKDSQRVVRWTHTSTFNLEMTKEDLEQNRMNKYTIVIPLVVDKDIAALRQGKNLLQIVLSNKTVNEKIRKTAEFSL